MIPAAGARPADVVDRLTVVLTLHGRAAFTRRWMTYAGQTRFPFQVLVADGSADDEAKRLFENPSSFHGVRYQYHRYPHDAKYSDYYAKLADVAERVQTPYVVLADNDDFFVVPALMESVRFLDAHPDYASCGGQGAQFWIRADDNGLGMGPVYGSEVDWKFTREPRSLESDSAVDRIFSQSISAADTSFYHVKRTTELRHQLAALRELDPHDLFLFEHLLCFLTVAAGKSKRIDRLYLFRQQNAGGSSGQTHQQLYGDWYTRMFRSTWSDEFDRFTTIVARRLAQSTNEDPVALKAEVARAYRELIAPALLVNILEQPSVTLGTATMLPLIRRLIRLPETSVLKRAARRAFRNLSLFSLDITYGTEIVPGKVPGSAEDFEPVQSFLKSGESAP